MNIYDIKNQTMNSSSNTTPEDMLLFLEKEKLPNEKDTWNKLGKTQKVKLLTEYADTYGADNSYTSENIENLKEYLKYSLTVTKLLKLKDLVYNKDVQKIEKIPMLCMANNKFYINRKKTVSNKPVKNRTAKKEHRTIKDTIINK